MSDAALSHADSYYRHSGRFTIGGLVVTLIAGVATGLVLGVTYGIAVWLIPFVYANFLLTIALGMGIGWVVGRSVRTMRVRNVPLAVGVGVISGLVGLHAAWVGWLFALSGWQAIFYSPVAIAQLLPILGEDGVWGMSEGATVKGVFLYLIWLSEAVMIVGVSAAFAIRALRKTPYCETCGKWMLEPQQLPPLSPIVDPDAVRRDMERGDFGILEQMTPADEEAHACAQLDLIDCDTCDNLHLLTMRNIALTLDKNGRVSNRNEQPIVRNLIIDRESSELISQIIRSKAAPSPDAPPTQADNDSPDSVAGQ